MLFVVGKVGHHMPIAARLNRYRRDDTVAGAFQQVPDERSADAEAHHHELTDKTDESLLLFCACCRANGRLVVR
jgi:hypothetical protein